MSLLCKIVAAATVLLGLVVGASKMLPTYGTKLEFNKGELYYTAEVTVEVARKLGEYLVKSEVFDGVPKTVQLDRRDGVYQFRMVIKPGLMNDAELQTNLRVYGHELCNKVFEGQPLEMHIANDSLKTVRVLEVTQSYGELLKFKAGELYFTSKVTRDEAMALGEYLVKSEFFDDTPKTAQLNKTGDIYEFRFVVKNDVDPDVMLMVQLRQYAKLVSEKVFGKQPVDLHLTDASLVTKKLVTSTGDFDRENVANGSLFPLLTEEMMQQIGRDLVESKFK
jgi:hypothetical protein